MSEILKSYFAPVLSQNGSRLSIDWQQRLSAVTPTVRRLFFCNYSTRQIWAQLPGGSPIEYYYLWNQKIEDNKGFISTVHLFIALIEDFQEKHEKLKTRTWPLSDTK